MRGMVHLFLVACPRTRVGLSNMSQMCQPSVTEPSSFLYLRLARCRRGFNGSRWEGHVKGAPLSKKFLHMYLKLKVICVINILSVSVPFSAIRELNVLYLFVEKYFSFILENYWKPENCVSWFYIHQIRSDQISHSVVYNSLRPHE